MTILKSNQSGKFDEAYKYLTVPKQKEFTFNNERFFHAEVGALLCDRMGKHSEAKAFAKKALEAAAITTPDFYKHSTIGLVDASPAQIKTLEDILKQP